MNNTLTLVTAPDDVSDDGLRILLVDLRPEFSSIVSKAFTTLTSIPKTILYVWENSENTEWLLDKKQKSKIIFFDAESTNKELVGYFAAQPNAYYFGNLKTLGHINKNVIFDEAQCSKLLGEVVNTHGKLY
jgi:hypothetical protein